MDVNEAILKRRSIRKFLPDKAISSKQLDTLIEAVRWAPSAGNRQSRFLFVVKNPKIKEKLTEASLDQEFISQAPVVFVICADLAKAAGKYGKKGEGLFALQDATIAGENLWLAVTGLGLGSCWVGAFDEDKVSKVLKLSSNLKPIAIFPIGYPAKTPLPTPREAKEKIYKEI